MTIWLLAVLLLAALAGLGLRQGAIRVLLSFFGIVIGGLLAGPLGHLFKPLLSAFGVKHPVYLALLPPAIGFLIVLTIFKVTGAVLNKKVETHFKYNSGELQLAMWERLNHRLGMALGLFNGAAYLVLVCIATYQLSYWTFQMASGDNDPKTVRVLNKMGQDLQKTGMYRVVGAVNRLSPTYYQAGDIVGLIYHNPLLQARLSRYPAIIGLSEQPAFQDLGNDKEFTELQMRQPPIIDIINYPKVQAILENPETIKTITNALVPNLSDLQAFLETGKSQTFTEEILGRWDFDLAGTMSLVRKARPNMTPAEAQKFRAALAGSYTKLTFVAAPEGMAKLKSFPHINRGTPPTIEFQDAQGQWSGNGGAYSLSLPVEGKDQQLKGEIRGDRLALSGSELNLGFVRED